MNLRRAWGLSGLVAARCGGRWRAAVRASSWLELVGGLGRVSGDGDAVLTLVPPRPPLGLVAVMVAVAGVAALATVGLVTWWPPAAMVLAGSASVAGLAGVVSWWRRQGARRRLRAVRPAGAWCVRNFASRRAGAGRALLAQVCEEADRKGRPLYLDTVAPRLVAYYRDLGFELVATELVHRSGGRVELHRMVRWPTRP